MLARTTLTRACKNPKIFNNGLVDLAGAISGENIRSKFKLFDVSLRDGLQTWKDIVPLSKKCNMLTNIMKNHNPDYMEIGSIVSPKVLPQFEDSIPLYRWANTMYTGKEFYILTPNCKAVKTAIENDISNLSFITSVSDEFQKKNIRKSLEDTKIELDKMFNEVDKSINVVKNIKVYVSCIDECPISGKIDKDYIVDEIQYYYENYNRIDKICLSDTCGTLEFSSFKKIMMNLDKVVPLYKVSLHLHFSDFDNISKIIEYAYLIGITDIDVSALENSGGCSVTIEKGKTNANLSYSVLNEINF